MANSDTGSRTDGMDHDFLAAFLGGEIQHNYRGAVLEEEGAWEIEANGNSGPTDSNTTCSNCCVAEESAQNPCVTEAPQCETKVECQTHHPQCKTHEHHCHHRKAYEPPKHASWFDQPKWS